MILSVAIMLVLGAILLAYILEPVLKADADQVEIDSAIESPELPDFRALVEAQETASAETLEEDGPVTQKPEPAEHRP